MPIKPFLNFKLFISLLLLSGMAVKASAQDQVIEKYAMCMATLSTLSTLGGSQKTEIDGRIKKVQAAAFGYIKKKSSTAVSFDANVEVFSKHFEFNLDYYSQAAQLGGYSLVLKAIETNLNSCD